MSLAGDLKDDARLDKVNLGLYPSWGVTSNEKTKNRDNFKGLKINASTSANAIILISRWNGLDVGISANTTTSKSTSFFLFLVLALMLGFALQQNENEMPLRRNKHKDIYPTWLCLVSENTGSRLPRA